MHICITHMGLTCNSCVPVPTVLVIHLYRGRRTTRSGIYVHMYLDMNGLCPNKCNVMGCLVSCETCMWTSDTNKIIQGDYICTVSRAPPDP